VRSAFVSSPQRPRPPASRRAVAVAVAVAALCVGACGGAAPTLSTGAVAHAIALAIQRESGIATRVTCPQHPPAQAGFHFSCVAHLAVGAYTVAVLETDAHGRVAYSGAGPLRALDTGAVERAIVRAMGSGKRGAASVHCPSPVLQRSGVTFTCLAHRRSGALVRFAVREDDDSGRVTLVGA
jgi:hypothetical protein